MIAQNQVVVSKGRDNVVKWVPAELNYRVQKFTVQPSH